MFPQPRLSPALARCNSGGVPATLERRLRTLQRQRPVWRLSCSVLQPQGLNTVIWASQPISQEEKGPLQSPATFLMATVAIPLQLSLPLNPAQGSPVDSFAAINPHRGPGHSSQTSAVCPSREKDQCAAVQWEEATSFLWDKLCVEPFLFSPPPERSRVLLTMSHLSSAWVGTSV